MENSKTIERVSDFALKIAQPLNKLAMIKGIKAVTLGLTATMPITIVGSIFMLLNVFSTPGGMGIEGFCLFPFFAGISAKFLTAYQLTLGCLGFWAALTIAQSYAELQEFDVKIASVVGILTFLMLATPGVVDRAISAANFGSTGLFVAMLGSVWMTKLYIFLDRKNIKLKLPPSVPGYVGESFGSIVPLLLITTICWLIRTILNLDVVNLINGILSPITLGAENPIIYCAITALNNLLWFCGLHGTALTMTVVQPLTAPFLVENAAAKAVGEALPHIWISTTIGTVSFVGFFWALIFLLLRSRADHLKAIGRAAAVPAFFNIQEPIVFGIPLVFNGFLIIPWILSNVVNSAIVWALSALNIIGRGFIDVSWACPAPLALFFSTGDLKSLIVIPISFIVALVITTPFFKAYEKSELDKMNENS